MNERECTLEDAAEALHFVSPEGRDTWVEMAFAVRAEFGDLGFDVWDAWSQGGSSYKVASAKSVWRSAKPAGRGGSVGIGTLFRRAMDNGYRFRPRTDEERERLQREAGERKRQRAIEAAEEQARIERAQAAIAALSCRLWGDYLAAEGQSPYLAEKGVGAFGVRFGQGSVIAWIDRTTARWALVDGAAAVTEFYNQHRQYPDADSAPYSFRHIRRGTLAVPLRDGNGELWSLQLIYPTGSKSFFRDGRKQGLFHLINPPAPSEGYAGRLWIAEGYSSAASVHQVMGEPVAMAVDAGNLLPVARTLRAQYPRADIWFAADNDLATDGNPGVTKATEAAAAVGGRVWVPVWPEVAA